MNTIDVIGLMLLSGAFVIYGVYAFIRTNRVLRDPDHPDHEDAKAAVAEQLNDPFRRL